MKFSNTVKQYPIFILRRNAIKNKHNKAMNIWVMHLCKCLGVYVDFKVNCQSVILLSSNIYNYVIYNKKNRCYLDLYVLTTTSLMYTGDNRNAYNANNIFDFETR